MQKKFIKREELEKYITSEDEIIFMDSSSISGITLPPRTVTVAIHGNLTAHNAQGTVYVVRHDSYDAVLLNTDIYAFSGELKEKVEMIGPLKTEHHHGDDIPSFLKAQAPNQVIDRVEEIRQGKLTDSNFL